MNGVFKALSDPTRRRVLQLLRDRPLTAGELADHFDVAKPTMSAHFAVLQQAGLVDAERNGRTIVYRLKMSVLEDALLGFAQTLGWNVKTAPKSPPTTDARRLAGDARNTRGDHAHARPPSPARRHLKGVS